MKFKKSSIIILLMIVIIAIPISFASDLDANGIDSNQLSENDDLVINDNLEENLEENLKESIDSDSNLDDVDLGFDLDDADLGSDNLAEELTTESIGESVDEEIIESSNEDEGSLSEVSSSNLDNSLSDSDSLSSNYNNDLPDLDTSFSQIEIDCTDQNTIFVNSSYASEGNGSQSNPFKTLEKAYEAYKKQSSKINIFLAKGTYSLSSKLSISKSVNIIGENPLNTIISGLNKNNMFHISDASGSRFLVNIINLTFSNGLHYKGGAIYCNKANLNIINTIFKDNHAKELGETSAGEGGAIYNDAGFIKIYNSTFVKNSIYGNYSKYGGAIYNNLGQLSIFNSTFVNNTIQGDWGSGGAIYNFNGFLTLVSSSILNTTINPKYHSLGGAICIWNGRNSYIINSTISGNTINGQNVFGSAIANKGVLLEIIDSTITNNFANGTSVENSTVYNINGICHYENLVFSNNRIKTINSSLLLCLEDQLILSDAFGIDTFEDLPSSYDLRDYGLVTSIKDQGSGTNSGNCWAFAIYGALESYLLKYENVAYDFSENNMKNAMYKNGINGTTWADGGNHIMAFAYLLRGSGPVNESQDKYNASSTYSQENLEISKYVTGFKYIPLRLNYLDNDQIKYAILEYGALYTSVDSSHFSRSSGTSYSNISSLNAHAVAIVGWDDNYSASNFERHPPGDGAWIIKNSWGMDDGQEGYYYISYYDSTFPGVTDQFSAIAISSVDNVSEYRSIYQYDPLGNTFESIGYNSNTAWFANQFTASSNNPLKAFGLYTFGSSTYLVNITVNGVSKLVQQGNLIGAGYHTVNLKSLVRLSKGDTFKITVKLSTPDSLFPIAIESYRTDYSTKVTASLNQSFISPDGIHWYDMAKSTSAVKFYQDLNKITLTKTNVCLKAYTEYADDLSIIIKANTSYFLEGYSIQLNITITNNGDLAKGINVSSIFDDGISIISSSASRGVFDKSTGIWTISQLKNKQSETLRLVLRFNKYKESSYLSVNANSSSLSYNSNVFKKFTFIYAHHTEFLKISNINTKVKSGETVKFTLLDAFNDPLLGKKISLSLLSSSNNYSMSPLVLNSSNAKFTLNLIAGYYKFMVSFKGEGIYYPSNVTFTVNVVKTATKIIARNLKTKTVVRYIDGKTGKYLKITLKDKDGNPLAGKTVKFIYNKTKYTRKTNKYGVASLQINRAKAGTYTYKISFAGDLRFGAFTKSVKVYVKKQSLVLKVANKKYKLKKRKKYLAAILKNSKGKRIKNKKITFIVNGKKYKAKTNSKGIAKVNVSLNKRKTYRFKVKFAGDKSYKAVSKKAKIVIK